MAAALAISRMEMISVVAITAIIAIIPITRVTTHELLCESRTAVCIRLSAHEKR